MASNTHASAPPMGSVVATTIPGRKVLLDLPPKTVVVATPERAGLGLSAAARMEFLPHPHEAGTGLMTGNHVSRPLNKPSRDGCPGGTGISRASCGRPTPDR